MLYRENEWFIFVLGMAAAATIMLSVLFFTHDNWIRADDYCPKGFDKPHLVLYSDHTWACTNGSQEQMVK
jgi:hypothetical protein